MEVNSSSLRSIQHMEINQAIESIKSSREKMTQYYTVFTAVRDIKFDGHKHKNTTVDNR